MPKRIEAGRLLKFCMQVLVSAGLDEDDAATVADVLVTTDTWGTFSHGTGALRNYVRSLQAGGMAAHAKPEIVAEGESWAVLDGQAGIGMPSCCRAMKVAVEKARKQTIAWAGVRNSNHFGAAGYYANIAAKENMIGIAMSNADPNMTIPGSLGHTIGNNPIAFAVPVGDRDPIFLDIALSAVAWGKIMSFKTQGKPIPANWITDADGLPTESLERWPATGSMIPMAGHKGYGIAVLVEVLAGLLTGAGTLDEITSWISSPEKKADVGHAFIAINIADIVPISIFRQRANHLAQKIHQAPKAKGWERIYLPGEIEWEHRADSLKNGIPVPDTTTVSLAMVGKELGVDISLFDGVTTCL